MEIGVCTSLGLLVNGVEFGVLIRNGAALETLARVATVAIEAMKFHRPVFVGDLVSCYADIARIGRTSITVHIETVVRRTRHEDVLTVTEGIFTYVAVDENGKPRPVAEG